MEKMGLIPAMGSLLVTGATGYIGHNLTRRLLGLGHTVHAMVRPGSETSRLQSLDGKLEIYIFDGDSLDLSQYLKRIRAGTVFHLAGKASIPAPGENSQPIIEANLLLGVRLMEAMAEADVRQIINTGSYWQFNEKGESDPNSLYAALKQAFHDLLGYYINRRNIRGVTLALFDVYGPGDWRKKLLYYLMEASKGTHLDLTDGKQTVDPVHVDDVVEAYITAYGHLQSGKFGAANETFFIGSGERLILRELVDTFEEECGKPLSVNWGAKPYPVHQIFYPCPAKPQLPGWAPRISLRDGLRQVLKGSCHA